MDQYPSGYTGMGNNPVSLVDPTGMLTEAKITARDDLSVAAERPSGGEDFTRFSFYGDEEMSDRSDRLWKESDERAQGEDALPGEAIGISMDNIPDISLHSPLKGGIAAPAADNGSGNVYFASAGGGDDDRTLGGSFANGFVGGAKSTWDGIKHEFTVDGLLSRLTDPTGVQSLASGISSAVVNISQNIRNYNANDYAYGAGFIAEKAAEAYVLHKANTAFSFKMNNGFGLFGEKGLNIGGYKIEAFYQDQNYSSTNKTGTYFSVKQQRTGGNNLRWDYGEDHIDPSINSVHSHFRFNIRGNTYGSSAQYPWYGPFNFWNYRRP